MNLLLDPYKKHRSTLFFLIFSVFIFIYSAAVPAENGQVIMIVAYDGVSWSPYVATLSTKEKLKQKSWKKIKSISNLVSITRQSGTGDFFVKKDNGEVVRYQLTEKSKLTEIPLPALQSDKINYTQLRAHAGGALAVKLYEGKSRQTEIINISPESNNTLAIINQAAAQFHPLQTKNSLFYGHVSCRLACDPVIQEVWRRDLASGKTQQLSLLNSTTYLHSVSKDERFAYLSSNQSGYYHLARLDLSSGQVDWLTKGQVTDSVPSLSFLDELYFIRRDSQGSRLLRLTSATSATVANDSNLEIMPLPKKIKKIRYLEISDQ
jgi:hypothetical protein